MFLVISDSVDYMKATVALAIITTMTMLMIEAVVVMEAAVAVLIVVAVVAAGAVVVAEEAAAVIVAEVAVVEVVAAAASPIVVVVVVRKRRGDNQLTSTNFLTEPFSKAFAALILFVTSSIQTAFTLTSYSSFSQNLDHVKFSATCFGEVMVTVNDSPEVARKKLLF